MGRLPVGARLCRVGRLRGSCNAEIRRGDDRRPPQPLGLQFGLAPLGWSLTGYEESRSIRRRDPGFWRAAGQLSEGSRFLLLAPHALTQEQVLQIAEQVTYAP